MSRRSSAVRGSVRGAAAAALRAGALALALTALGGGAAPWAAAQEPEREERLPGSGIRYPLGYDPETEGSVEGRLLQVETPPRGPVVLHVEATGRTVKALVAPQWFWEAGEGRPAPGELVRVVGSKTLGADGDLYLVVREIETPASGCSCSYRDGGGQPLWRGRRHGAPPRRCQPPEHGPPGRR